MAIRAFEAQLKGDPANFDVLAFLGWLYLESDRAEEAEQLLERARRIKPDNPDVLFQLARLARQKGSFKEAALLLERVIALRPAHTQAHVLLAQTYFRLNRREDGQREQEIVKRLNEQEREKRLRDTALPAPPQ
jgi:cytochrome c-type biogenesis protein CcmH/NrfG